MCTITLKLPPPASIFPSQSPIAAETDFVVVALRTNVDAIMVTSIAKNPKPNAL
jgi:hypothetical protein